MYKKKIIATVKISHLLPLLIRVGHSFFQRRMHFGLCAHILAYPNDSALKKRIVYAVIRMPTRKGGKKLVLFRT